MMDRSGGKEGTVKYKSLDISEGCVSGHVLLSVELAHLHLLISLLLVEGSICMLRFHTFHFHARKQSQTYSHNNQKAFQGEEEKHSCHV